MQPCLFINGSPKSTAHFEHFKEVGGCWKEAIVEKVGFTVPNFVKEKQLVPAMLRKSKLSDAARWLTHPARQTQTTPPRQHKHSKQTWDF